MTEIAIDPYSFVGERTPTGGVKLKKNPGVEGVKRIDEVIFGPADALTFDQAGGNNLTFPAGPHLIRNEE